MDDTEVRVRSVRSTLLIAAAGQALLAVAVAVIAGWVAAVVALGCGVALDGLVARAIRGARFGPADLVTLVRASLATTVAGLVGNGAAGWMVALAAIALVLDGVDGWIARRTGTGSAFGARFDMEVDAFLILVLSVEVARTMAPWALAIGLARYAYVVAGWMQPWLRAPVPPRFWRKVVAAVQGIVLAAAVAGALPGWVSQLAIIAAMLLLAESFGRDIAWAWDHVRVAPPRTRLRTARRWLSTAVGLGVVWFALLTPGKVEQVHPSAFLRLPVEALVVVAIGFVLPVAARRWFTFSVGVLLAMLAVLKLLDMGFNEAIDRNFNPVGDWSSLGPAIGVLRDSVGRAWTTVAVCVAVALLLVLPVLAGTAVVRVTGAAARHRGPAARVLAALGVLWLAAAALGTPLASGNASRAVYAEAGALDSAIADQHRFSTELESADPMRFIPADHLLSRLRGKDVLLVFVESYGRVAVRGTSFSPGVDAVLRDGNRRLAAAGFSARSAFLNSPTFGGISWLAHSTLQSGLWVNSPKRYSQLIASKRFTLSDAFKRAGWRTVADVPSNRGDWPQGRSFYHYDALYDGTNVGYRGPSFSYAAMPDQFTLAAFRRLELNKPHRQPLMAEIDLVSSHTPWTPLPHLIDWGDVGDGTVYDGMPQQGPTPSQLWQSAAAVQASYGKSIEYSLQALISYVQNYGDPNLVMVVLGDHQPAKIVSGERSGHEVPISLITADRSVLHALDGWKWQDGLLPSPTAPTEPMDRFRNRFLKTFSS